jgi:hypothetical protein
MPSKFWSGDEIGPDPFFWMTGSFAVLVPLDVCSSSLSRAVMDVTGSATRTGRLFTAADTPSKRPLTTFGLNDDNVVARAVRAARSGSARSRSLSALAASTPPASASNATSDPLVLSCEMLPTRTAAPSTSVSSRSLGDSGWENGLRFPSAAHSKPTAR